MHIHKSVVLEQTRKSSSTSSIYAKGSIADPRVSDIVSSVATMLHCQMMRDVNASAAKKKLLPYFCEEQYTGKEIKEMPNVKGIYTFLKTLFEVGQFHPECCVISLVYINRLIGVTGVPLTQSNWKPVTVSALVLAQKVWDDTPLINADFSILYPALTAKEINLLERRFLDHLDFKLSVSPSLYAQYYFELRSICEENTRGLRPLTQAQARRLQTRSHLSEQYQRKKNLYKKRTMTEDELRVLTKHSVLS
jgi:hypothetical protein